MLLGQRIVRSILVVITVQRTGLFAFSMKERSMNLFTRLVLALVLCPFLSGCGDKVEQPQSQSSQAEADGSNPSQTD